MSCSNKKNRAVAVCIVLICLLSAVSVVLLLYNSELCPNFSAAADALLCRIFSAKQTDFSVSEVPKDSSAEPLPAEVAAASWEFRNASAEEAEKINSAALPPPLVSGKTEISISDDGYTLTASLTNGEQLWSYENIFPIASAPVVYADAVVFTDCDPALVSLHLEDGRLLQRVPSPVYPAQKAAAGGTSYIFSGRAGGVYVFAAVFDETLPEIFAEDPPYNPAAETPQENTAEPPHYSNTNVPLVSMPASAAIAERIAFWLPNVRNYAPEQPLVLPADFHPVAAALSEKPQVFVFCVPEQGQYTAGLCDENGAWISAKAFCAVFTQSGEMQAVSLDYVADRPQVSLHFSAGTVYYAVCGKFPEELADIAWFFTVKEAAE
ncbi:MAG: hypothetical protein NC041_04950 [Bacteroides sp.]|nr:hypothetical protein [Prevotella sp.]MCM1407305.1 hypothetical protein [Treponema brennaborense]MCM1469795.1 hypothetical protein [Bacteroides sp.]